MESKIIDWNGRSLEVFEDGTIYRCAFVDSIGRPRAKKLLDTTKKQAGYCFISLPDENGANRPIGVHRVVSKAWDEYFDDAAHVHHINGIKSDNHCGNLECLLPKHHLKLHGALRKFGTGKIEFLHGFDGVYYEEKMKGYAYMFPMAGGIAYGGYWSTAKEANDELQKRIKEESK